METVIYKTIHGSHLYGLAHATSDRDYYTVVLRHRRGARKKYAKQNITDGIDSMKVDFSTFRHFCDEGVPQALEALWSPRPEIDLLTAFRWSYRLDTAKATRTYRRTLRNFAEGDFKKRRHAMRLWLNMLEFQSKGYFHPTLTPAQILTCNSYASMGDEMWHHWIDNILGGTNGPDDSDTRNPGQR